jgi:hypothetical protein
VLRLSYVIRADNSVVFGLDFPHLEGTSRLLHSQLSGGRNFYPAGRIEILRRQEQFASVDSWRKSDRLLRNKGFPAWRASKLDNGTGHGECGPEAAVWAAKIILPALATIGITTNECRVTDVFTPNMPII